VKAIRGKGQVGMEGFSPTDLEQRESFERNRRHQKEDLSPFCQVREHPITGGKRRRADRKKIAFENMS
jgi:hypothetical protein